MVDPDLKGVLVGGSGGGGGCGTYVLGDLNGDCVASDNFGDGEVADDDILYVLDGESEAVED